MSSSWTFSHSFFSTASRHSSLIKFRIWHLQSMSSQNGSHSNKTSVYCDFRNSLMFKGVFELTLEIAEVHGKKFSWTFNMASNVPKACTLKKWIAKFEWLEICDNHMYCWICTKWQKKLASCRNYSNVFLTKGSNNWQRSTINEPSGIPDKHSDANNHENRETLGDQFRKHVVHNTGWQSSEAMSCTVVRKWAPCAGMIFWSCLLHR